jgi:hypothetical protein
VRWRACEEAVAVTARTKRREGMGAGARQSRKAEAPAYPRSAEALTIISIYQKLFEANSKAYKQSRKQQFPALFFVLAYKL